MLRFKTTTVHGHGRGRDLGFPTINMIVPANIPMQLAPGVYAAHAKVGEEKYAGALFYGPASTFGQKNSTLEIYLLDTVGFYIGEGEAIEIEVVKFIRSVIKFDLPELLIIQMEKDEAAVRQVLGK